MELELINCKETCKRLRDDNQELLYRLENAGRRIKDMEREKFTVDKIILIGDKYATNLMIKHIHSTPAGLVIEVSQ